MSTLKPIVYPPSDVIMPWLYQVHCGDCVDLMGQMPAGSVDLVVTSPPYNLRNTTGGQNRGNTTPGQHWAAPDIFEKGYTDHGDCMPHDDYVEWQRECIRGMLRVLTSDGAIFYNHKWRVQRGLMQDRADIMDGFPVRQIIIWQRAGGLNFNPGYFLPTYEVVYLIAKQDFRLAPGANKIGDVWKIAQDTSGNPHPASFPLELARRCIESTTAQVILDPFMGSGTTGIAAQQANRDWIGIDISEEYCQMAHKRIDRDV